MSDVKSSSGLAETENFVRFGAHDEKGVGIYAIGVPFFFFSLLGSSYIDAIGKGLLVFKLLLADALTRLGICVGTFSFSKKWTLKILKYYIIQ